MLLISAALLLFSTLSASEAETVDANTAAGKLTVLIVLDGYRNDYLESFPLQVLNQSGNSLHAAKLSAIFPSSRLPNLATFATGVHSDEHGVIDEVAFDHDLQRTINFTEPQFWDKATILGSIWKLSRDSDVNTKVVGFSASSNLWLQEKTTSADTNVTDEEPTAAVRPILNQTQEFLQSSVNASSSFLTVLLDEPGRTAQAKGPLAVNESIAQVNVLIEKIARQIESSGRRLEDVDLMVTSTPGYSAVTMENMINLERFVTREFQAVGSSCVLNIVPSKKSDNDLYLYADLQGGASTKLYEVYTKTNLPESWHFKSSPRVQPIVVVAKEGVVFSQNFLPRIEQFGDLRGDGDDLTFGANGYASSDDQQETFFFGHGPSFRIMQQQQQSQPTANRSETLNLTSMDVFPLLCNVLKISCPESRCVLRSEVRRLLVTDEAPGTFKATLQQAIGIVSSAPRTTLIISGVSVGFLFLACLCILCLKRKKKQAVQEGFKYSQIRSKNRLKSADDIMADEDGDSENGEEQRRGLLQDDDFAAPETESV